MKHIERTTAELLENPRFWVHVPVIDVLNKHIPEIMEDKAKTKLFVSQMFTHCKDVLDVIFMSSTGSVYPFKTLFAEHFAEPDGLPKRKPTKYGTSTLRSYIRTIRSHLVKGMLFNKTYREKLLIQANSTLDDSDYETFLYMLKQELPDKLLPKLKSIVSEEPVYKPYKEMLLSNHAYLPPMLVRKIPILFDNKRNTEVIAYVDGRIDEFLVANGLVYSYDQMTRKFSFNLDKNSAPDKSKIDDPHFMHAWKYGQYLMERGVKCARLSVASDGVIGMYNGDTQTLTCIRKDILDEKFELPEYVFHHNMLAEKYRNFTPIIMDGDEIQTIISMEHGTVAKRQLQASSEGENSVVEISTSGFATMTNGHIHMYDVESAHGGAHYIMLALDENPIAPEQKQFNCVSITDAKMLAYTKTGGGGKYFYYRGK